MPQFGWRFAEKAQLMHMVIGLVSFVGLLTWNYNCHTVVDTLDTGSAISAFYAAYTSLVQWLRSWACNHPGQDFVDQATRPRDTDDICLILTNGLLLFYSLSSKHIKSFEQTMAVVNGLSMDLHLLLQFCKLRAWLPVLRHTLRLLHLVMSSNRWLYFPCHEVKIAFIIARKEIM